ncbi:MAG TPA: copper oxidase [Thermoanaerobaculia bacterium]|nr:copper oxidase [Thermoanaerobaculia bacterium]
MRLRSLRSFSAALSLLVFTLAAAAQDVAPRDCPHTVVAEVVALDVSYQINRLGTSRPGGLIFALRSDVEPLSGSELTPGNVQLKSYKRPRPMVLRVNEGDCLEIRFQNLLAPQTIDPIQPATRNVSIHAAGMNLRPMAGRPANENISSDGTWVGQNPLAPDGMSGVVKPGDSITYALYASAEGAYLLYSTPGDYNNFSTMQLTMGLFGAINVEPRGSEWYRSQVTEADLRMASVNSPPNQLPTINYDAVYPPGNPRAGKPILRMLDRENHLVHSDLTAVITGEHRGLLPGGPGDNPVLPNRNWPFREVTVHYHESQDVVQSFAYFYNGTTSHVPTVNAGSDSFAINYGLAGIGPEILANRIGVGPTTACDECKFEEFFLSSWPQGDPGLVVDVPANAEVSALCQNEVIFVGRPLSRACAQAQKQPTKAFYPDDPSNVYHSYLGDHVRFRILHAGAAVTHVHHHHAHQWLHSGDDQNSNYLDSQSIGPGSSFTLELVYNGSGNRNLTVGDTIFHCHFYPHFASGMWALYRVHDVFEPGTPLDDHGRPQAHTRALPDPEIMTGTPIPAVVPLPMMAMAPYPAPVEIEKGQVKLGDSGFPGYPFYIPGISGHRAPHPPMDFAVDPQTNETYDGGLPRHLMTNADVANEQHSLTDWSKDLANITAFQLPEDGTPAEKRAFDFFKQYAHRTMTPDGTPADFHVNGLPLGPQSGAPFADPAVVDGKAVGNPKLVYRGVDLQLDAVFNKAGWHYPQQRMMALWGDVNAFLSGQRPPEPLFFRAESNDVIEYWHTNLVPAYFELDDFEVRTPTDIIGQHIHLVKFDVTSSDGAANGFNYEDGTFSPEEVRDRIEGINATGGLWDYARKTQKKLTAKPIPELGVGPTPGAWVGAQATVQRWWVDPLMDTTHTDRTYMTVFTHDHFGPSTHQMIGLYGGLLVEPPGTTWTSLDGKTKLRDWASRNDGGPTSYAANILYSDPADSGRSYREFGLAWGDLQMVYAPTSKPQPDCYSYDYNGTTYAQTVNCKPVTDGNTYTGWADGANVINCAQCATPNAPTPNFTTIASSLGLGVAPSPAQPFLIADFGAGMMSMNYRTEPLPLRINKPAKPNPGAGANAGDLAYAFASIPRFDPAFSQQPAGGTNINPACSGTCFTFPVQPISAGMGATDPYTPLLSGYEGDNVQIRTLVGSHTSMHDFAMHGVRWLYEPFSENSGHRATQFTILSEHFEMLFGLPRIGAKSSADYLYNPSASYEGLTNGIWGLVRAFNPMQQQPFLAPLRATPPPAVSLKPPVDLSHDCEHVHPCLREFVVHATAIEPSTTSTASLVYNGRGIRLPDGTFDVDSPLEDPWAIVYHLEGKPIDPATVEPLVLRAAAGDWIHVVLRNDLKGTEPVFTNANATEPANRAAQIPYANPYYTVNLTTSATVGLHPQLLELDVTRSDGANIGNNPAQTAAPGGSTEYWWYAGKMQNGQLVPVEYGAVNLTPADPLMQVYHGLFGALVVEPEGSHWTEDPMSPTAATVFAGDQVYREFVLMVQDDTAMQLNGNSLYQAAYPLSAFNYKTEPAFFRFGALVDPALGISAPTDWSNLSASDVQNVANVATTGFDTTQTTANKLVGGDPVTPILRAPAGMPVRIHLLSPGGIGDNQQVFELTGHVWQETPFTNASTKIGFNPQSMWTGTTSGYGPTSSYPIVLQPPPTRDGSGSGAGGRFGIPGDYLYRSWTANQFQAGVWGIFRVAPNNGPGFADTVGITSVHAGPGGYLVSGFTTVSPRNGHYAESVTVTVKGASGKATVRNGVWTYKGRGAVPSTVTVRSSLGGTATWGTLVAEPVLVREAGPHPLIRQDQRPRQPR